MGYLASVERESDHPLESGTGGDRGNRILTVENTEVIKVAVL